VTRLSRKVLATLGAVAATAIVGALVFALQSRSPRQETTELHSTDHKTTADELEKLPKDYSGLPQAPPPRPIPQLGPPLPGDLGRPIPLGQKIEAVEGIVPVRRSLVGRCAAIGMMQQRIALDCCESHSQKQAQLKVGAFEPQPSVCKN
jgi:type IV secretory pathway VirB10-like protein